MFHAFLNYILSTRLPALAVATTLTVAVTACGKTSQKVLPQASTQSASGTGVTIATLKDPACTSAANCPAVDFSIVDESGSSTLTTKSVNVGTAVKWSYSIKSNAITGRLMMGSREIPTWASIENGDTAGTKIIAGTPDQKVASGNIVFVVRDMMKCKVNEKDLGVCTDVEKDLAYDKLISAPYTVIDNSVPTDPSTNYSDYPGTPTRSPTCRTAKGGPCN